MNFHFSLIPQTDLTVDQIIATNGPITVRFSVRQGGANMSYNALGSNVSWDWAHMDDLTNAAERWYSERGEG
jgi:hypothetical protein